MPTQAQPPGGPSGAGAIHSLARCLTLACWVVAPVAHAQTAPFVKRADPTDPQAAVAPLHYVGVLATYRALKDLPPLTWEAANEKTNRIGGWRAYAREPLPAAENVPSPGPDGRASR
ncbi:hypothetical protein [Inhella gelatinilytica]|uniref:Uncharacterized protein n=1 Tax=Inhella gelatinilytica TaxID=2795030 RepID=A0A931NBJ8_9BURK|nr:hypothetical protein [Inhella gelatinilytica]MBH9553653.1 hypothetical protein [Inhella gelatinilytica]